MLQATILNQVGHTWDAVNSGVERVIEVCIYTSTSGRAHVQNNLTAYRLADRRPVSEAFQCYRKALAKVHKWMGA